MTTAEIERIRAHRRSLATQWARQVADTPTANPLWRDARRIDRHMQAAVDALVDAAATERPEPFVEFAGRLSQDAFALQIPLDEVIRALLQVKPVILEFLAHSGPAPEASVDAVQTLNRLLSAAILEAIRRHERQRDRRSLAAQEHIDELRERVRRQVLVDPTTGLFNANYFTMAVRRETLRGKRFGRAFTICLVSLDQDDDMREAMGDQGLRAISLQLADLLTRHTRQVDVRAALGGGRFGVILPETEVEGAFVVAERLRQAVEQARFVLPDHSSPITQTVSIGLACYPRDGDTDQSLLARTEEALARARAGKNTTVAAATASDS
jgi:diguanylate cyclase (GGDEF)-like protein